jgi:hypothetical protein
MTGSKKKQPKREDPISASQYKVILFVNFQFK